MNKSKALVSLVLNGITASVTAFVVVLLFFIDDPVLNNGWESFRFFTTDANILTAAASAIVAFHDVRILRGKADALPRYAELLKFTGVVSLMLTFITVMTVLVPVYGIGYELGGTNFHVHLAAPMMSLFSFLFCEFRYRISLKESLLSLLPPAVYAVVYYVMVVAIGSDNGGWIDFYCFNQGGHWFSALLAVLLVTFIIGTLIRGTRKRPVFVKDK